MAGEMDCSGRSLLAVFAHPDDESIACGGLLARCADLGVRVTLVCATNGENRGGMRDEDFFVRRPLELHEAAGVLGVSEVVLLGYRDGFLAWTSDLSDRIEQEILRVRPDAVVTFGNDGLYWHPDHIAVWEATTSAVDALGADGPPLYYVTLPQGQMRRIVSELHAGELETATMSLLGIADPDAFGTDAIPPTIVVDIARWAGRKLAALRCHRSQVDNGALARIPEHDAAHFFGVEHLHRPVGSRFRSRISFLDFL